MSSISRAASSMRRVIRGVGAAALVALVPVQPSAPPQEAMAALTTIHREYVAQRERPRVAWLVQKDRELRRLLPYWRWEGPPVRAADFRPELEQIGVRRLPFDPDVLAYSGKLLIEAHRQDSLRHRRYTLYSTVFGEREINGSVPSPRAAEAYLAEFPEGPFAVHAHLALAGFYSDLAQVLQHLENGAGHDYKYACYRQYVEQGRFAQQKTRAQAQAIAHASTLTKIRPRVAWFGELLGHLTAGAVDYWHYCAD